MNESVFTQSRTDPRFVYEALSYVKTMHGSNPAAELRGFASLGLVPTNQVVVAQQSSVRPMAVFCKDQFGVLVLLAGTQGLLHVSQLINGWENPNAAVNGSGCNVAFENAVYSLLNELPTGFLFPEQRVRIVGYSYGGAVGQCLADLLQNVRGYRNVDCLSVASLRPGTQVFQRRMQTIRHTRWWAELDPVRWIPPHINEVPSLLTVCASKTWRGMDTQVQTPEGYGIYEEGQILHSEGEPTRLHSVIFSLASWVTDNEGFQSVNHAIDTYRDLVFKAIVASSPVTTPPSPPPLDRPANITIGQAAFWQEQGVADMVADPGATQQPGQMILVERLDRSLPSRYKRRKVGSVWTVQLDGLVVAVGPGKRRAGQIARSMNRAAIGSS
jgi:hypothetical protein